MFFPLRCYYIFQKLFYPKCWKSSESKIKIPFPQILMMSLHRFIKSEQSICSSDFFSTKKLTFADNFSFLEDRLRFVFYPLLHKRHILLVIYCCIANCYKTSQYEIIYISQFLWDQNSEKASLSGSSGPGFVMRLQSQCQPTCWAAIKRELG